MKLKKFAALALAGVMAVSMLAGCANKPGSSEPTTEPTSGVTADAVIKALNEETTKSATFSANSALQATVDEAMKYVETDKVYTGKFDAALLRALNEKLPTAGELAAVNATSSATDKVEQTAMFILESDNSLYGANDATVVSKLAALVDSYNNVGYGYLGWTNLPVKSTQKFNDSVYAGKYLCNFTYTANLAVTSQANEQGQLTYYVVVTVTRTPAPFKV